MLATKLYIPPARPKIVHRPRLVERLHAGLHRKLTLISAPAGFGKTTLVSEWIHDKAAVGETALPASLRLQPSNVAWLSLDERDDDLIRFLTHLVAALQTVAPNLGEGVLGILQSAQPPREAAACASLLTLLLNEITTLPDHFVLVLDDYHVLEAKPIDLALTFLIEHLPPQMHLVITTREDPQLPLARLRARGQLTELRAADLRFSAAEAAAFLNQVMDLSLSAADIAALEERTEGWIAGLQLAALSLQDQQDVSGFIRLFAGDHRYIVDYLVEEVLQRQPAPVRSFLLQSAILDRLNGPLCDAVTEFGRGSGASVETGALLEFGLANQTPQNSKAKSQNSQMLLEQLERGNFFIVPLDDKRHWYRYHHLFAEVLAAHLRAEQPDQLSTLHRRASAWYEQQGMAADAIRHALAGQDFAHAADLVELAVPVTRRGRQEAMLLGWLKALPEAVVRCRPVLSVHYAGTLLQSGELTGVEERLRDAERWLDTGLDTGADLAKQPPAAASDPLGEPSPAQSHGMVVMDQAEFRRLPGWLANYRAAYALIRDDVHNTLRYARQALDLIPEDDHFGRGAAAALLGLAYWTSGDLNAAYRTYADGMAHLQRAGYIADAIGGAIALADIRITQGRLHEAMRIYEQGLQLATAHGNPVLRGTADMYVGMSELCRERDDLPSARQHLLRSKAQGEHTGFPQNPYRWHVAMARIQMAEGDLDSALDLLQEAVRLYVSDFFPNVRPVAALKTRVWLAQGRLDEALDWVREQGLSVDNDLSYRHEFEHITLARVLLARYQRDHAAHALSAATHLLARLLKAAEEGGRMGRAIEILVVQALAHHLQGNTAAALMPLERALTLAYSLTGAEYYVRSFVDEGPPMRSLLLAFSSWLAQQPPTEQTRQLAIYVNRLLAAFANEPWQEDEPLSMAPIQTPNAKRQTLIEPLSERELDVLRLFKTELSGPEIAQQLVIGLSTVRTHTKNIYSKLHVNSRRAAVNRAAELNLL